MPTRDHRFRTRIDRLIYRLKYQYSMGSVGHSLDFSTKARRRHFNFFFFVQHRVGAMRKWTLRARSAGGFALDDTNRKLFLPPPFPPQSHILLCSRLSSSCNFRMILSRGSGARLCTKPNCPAARLSMISSDPPGMAYAFTSR